MPINDVIIVEVVTSGLRGPAVSLRHEGDYIQWSVEARDDWHDLVPLDIITGPPGPPIELRAEGALVQWRAVTDAEWTDLLDVGALVAKATASAIRTGTGDGYLSPPETWAAQEPVELDPAAPDLGSGITFKLTLAANTVLADPIGARLGQEGSISIFRPGDETLSFGPAWRGFGSVDLPADAGKGAEMPFRVVSLTPLAVRFSIVQEL